MGEREAGVWNIIEETGVEIWGWLTGTKERKGMIKGEVETLNPEHTGQYRKGQLEPMRRAKGKPGGIAGWHQIPWTP